MDINILSGEKKISDFDGTLAVKMPYNGPQPVAVWYLNNKGELEKLSCTFSDGMVSFVLDHLSLFMVGQDNEGREASLWKNPFADIQKTDWFYSSVEYISEKGLMKGTSTTTFGPHEATTRGMIITVLHRLEGSPAATVPNPFNDVATGQYYTDAIIWAAGNKIVTGYGQGKFGPNETITREQMAVILMNYAKFKGYDVSTRGNLAGFADLNTVSIWALDALSWANAKNLIQGDGGKLLPGGKAERCQVAAIFQRLLENTTK